MADINALYRSLLAADEARDAAALTAVAWQMYEVRPSGNGQRPELAASARLRLGASQPSPTGRPNEGHRRWPRQDNGCLPAAGLTAPLPVANLGPDLPCAHDPELFFAESPDDVETAKALCRACPARAACLAGALKRREPWGVWGGELLLRGAIAPRKRPRGRPRQGAT
jgi:WhiB family transcriptional regulator, redox-sensing transcriptional regulator